MFDTMMSRAKEKAKENDTSIESGLRFKIIGLEEQNRELTENLKRFNLNFSSLHNAYIELMNTSIANKAAAIRENNEVRDLLILARRIIEEKSDPGDILQRIDATLSLRTGAEGGYRILL